MSWYCLIVLVKVNPGSACESNNYIDTMSCWHFCWLYLGVVSSSLFNFCQCKYWHLMLDTVDLSIDCIFYWKVKLKRKRNLRLSGSTTRLKTLVSDNQGFIREAKFQRQSHWLSERYVFDCSVSDQTLRSGTIEPPANQSPFFLPVQKTLDSQQSGREHF